MNNNKKFLKRSVAAFLAAVNIFNFSGGSSKAILWERSMLSQDSELNIELKQKFEYIIDIIYLNQLFQALRNMNTNSLLNSKFEFYKKEGEDNKIIEEYYILKIYNDEFNVSKLDELNKSKKICIYTICEDVSEETINELNKKFNEIENVLFVDVFEFLYLFWNQIDSGTSLLMPQDETILLEFLNEILSLTSPKSSFNISSVPKQISELISKIKSGGFNNLVLELSKRNDRFILISNILKDLVEILKKEKESYETDKEKKLTREMLSNGLSYNDKYSFNLIELGSFLGNIEFEWFESEYYFTDNTFKINDFIDELSYKKFIDGEKIKKLKGIDLDQIMSCISEDENEILDKEVYLKKIDEYIKTLEEIIKVISIHCELEEIRTKNNELSEENKKLNSSSKKWKIFAGCGWVGTLLGLGYILKNELSNKYSTSHKKVLELKNSILG